MRREKRKLALRKTKARAKPEKPYIDIAIYMSLNVYIGKIRG